ncbi:hypothetical protein ACNKHU_17520 [Shigella flexneri]
MMRLVIILIVLLTDKFCK